MEPQAGRGGETQPCHPAWNHEPHTSGYWVLQVWVCRGIIEKMWSTESPVTSQMEHGVPEHPVTSAYWVHLVMGDPGQPAPGTQSPGCAHDMVPLPAGDPADAAGLRPGQQGASWAWTQQLITDKWSPNHGFQIMSCLCSGALDVCPEPSHSSHPALPVPPAAAHLLLPHVPPCPCSCHSKTTSLELCRKLMALCRARP